MVALVATLAEFKSWLRWQGSGTSEDAKLTDVLTSASEWIEKRLDTSLTVTSFTESHRTNGWAITPNKKPLVSVTSITPELGTALNTSWYTVDTTSNVVRFYWGIRPCWVTLVYTAGYASIPYKVKNAGLELARHLWLTQNGSTARGRADDEPSPMGFAVPNRVIELLADDPVMGFA